MTGYTAVLVALAVAMVAGSYARQGWPRFAAWLRHRAARPRFDSSADYRRQLALWRTQRDLPTRRRP